MNLVGNAIKFTQKGEVSLTSTWTPDDSSILEEDRNKVPLTKFISERTKDLLEWNSIDKQLEPVVMQHDSCELAVEEIDEHVCYDNNLD